MWGNRSDNNAWKISRKHLKILNIPIWFCLYRTEINGWNFFYVIFTFENGINIHRFKWCWKGLYCNTGIHYIIDCRRQFSTCYSFNILKGYCYIRWPLRGDNLNILGNHIHSNTTLFKLAVNLINRDPILSFIFQIKHNVPGMGVNRPEVAN